MTGQAAPLHRLLRLVTGQGLFYASLAVFLTLALVFCLSVFSSANRAHQQTLQSVEAQMLRILEDSGVSGLATAFDRSRNIVLPGTDRLELALWQVRGESRRILLETIPGAAAAFDPGNTTGAVEGVTFKLRPVDVANASEDWALPMQDVALVFGMETPDFEIRRAQRTVLTIVVVSLLVCGLMVLLQIGHWQRYRRSLQRVNLLLERYSSGETRIRFEDENPAPELRELGRQLNVALPRIDELFSDLRALSAHLAHEVRTPLQNVRSGLRRMLRAKTDADRQDHARRIDAGIDAADARLQSIMQLFRLQADAEILIEPDIALGEVFEDLVYDFEESLTARGRDLTMQIDKSVRVMGNTHLLELLLANLLSNAAKYAPEMSEIRISLNQQGEQFDLEISNDGRLPKGFINNAFDRYAQGSGGSGETGYGLGLGLVKAIAQKHGFQASLAANPDGTRVVASVHGAALPGPVEGENG